MPTIELLPDERPNPFQLNNVGNDIPADFDSLSEEDKNILLDHVAQQFASDPKAMERLAAELMNVTKNDFHTVTIQPQSGYVIRTKITADKTAKYKVGMSVYINICHAEQIPEPPVVPEREIEKALNADPDATYRVPLSMGEPRFEKDAAGNTCLVMDACIHTRPYLRSERDLDYRLYIIELSIEWVEEKESVELSREFTMPKMTSKGEIPKRLLRLPKPALISTVRGKHSSWKCSPIITTDNKTNCITVAIPQLPSVNASSWTVDIEPSQIILSGVAAAASKIPLPQRIQVDAASNSAQFYRKSRDLVIQLAIAPASTRSQYL